MEETWIKYQEENSKNIIKEDTLEYDKIKYIGGLDISFKKEDPDQACAYLTVYDIIENKIVYEDHKLLTLTLPYVSGLLGFRELPVYKDLIETIKKDKPEFFPHVVMVDGFGIFHHRNFGSASHLGYDLDIPTIGVGKTLLCIDGLDKGIVKDEFNKKCKVKGDYIELVGETGKIYGVALKGSDNTNNPIYVSIGHKISLESCIKLVNKCCNYRVPEPIRNSDIKSKLFL